MNHDTAVPGFRGEVTDVRVLPDGDPSLPPGPNLLGMAEEALGCLTRNPAPAGSDQCRFSFFLLCSPPFCPLVQSSTASDEQKALLGRETHIDPIAIADTESRNDIAFNLMREITGSELGRQPQEAIHHRLLGYVRSGKGEVGDDLCWAIPYCMSPDWDGEYVMPWPSAMLLHSETDLFRLTGDDSHRRTARRLFEGLRRVAHWDTGRAFYPGGVAPFREGRIARGYLGHYPNVLSPLVYYWLHCQDPEALEFARAMAEGFLSDLQPGHLHKPDGHVHGHNHLQMHAIRGLAQLGALTNDWRYLNWAQAAYDFYYTNAFDTGWLPEIVWLPDHSHHSETCLTADMMETEVWLASAGRPDLWDRVDRTVRNYLAPMQFHLTPEVEALWRQVNSDKPREEINSGLAVLRELEGGFLSAMTPNDRIFEVPVDGTHAGIVDFRGSRLVLDMMGCCPPSGMRALYLAWANTVQTTSEGVFINLAFDHDGPQARVISDLPGLGRLRAVPKVAADFWLRPPAWAPRAEVKAWRDGVAVEPKWGGPAHAYLAFPQAQVNETLEIGWPLVQLTQRVTERFMEQEEPAVWTNGSTYTYHWTGSTVTSVEPQGRWLPPYG